LTIVRELTDGELVCQRIVRLVKPKFHSTRHVTSRHDTTRSTC